MQQLLDHPAVQSSIVPLLVGLTIGVIFYPLRLSGLGVAGGFLATVYLVGNFSLEPLTATRKMVLVGAAAPLVGVIADLAFRPIRAAGMILGAVFGATSSWVFWTVLSQRAMTEAVLLGGGTAFLVLWLVAVCLPLHDDPVRAGAAGLGLGLGVGTAAILGASAMIGQYGLALGAACGGFLLLVMCLGKRVAAGMTLVLTVAVACGLLAAGAVILAKLSWWSVAALALVPLAVYLPLPAKAAVWIQTVLASIYCVIVAVVACGIAYVASRNAVA